MAKKITIHTDILGREITMSSKLAVSRNNQLLVCSVIKLSDKMLRVEPISSDRSISDFLVYGSQTIILEGPDALAYILKKQ